MLVPLKLLRTNPTKYGFKKCKRPYDGCWYICFAKGAKLMFLSTYMIQIVPWRHDDPRVHVKANCKYRDNRTAEDYLCELIQLGLVDTHYGHSFKLEKCEENNHVESNNC